MGSVVNLQQKLHRVFTTYLKLVGTRTAVGLFITLARQSGTRCQMNLEILSVLMALNDTWNKLHTLHTWNNSFQPLLC